MSTAVLKWCNPKDREILEYQLPGDYHAFKEGEEPFQAFSRTYVEYQKAKEALKRMREELPRRARRRP